jgi:fatty-acyl-CoA synthase
MRDASFEPLTPNALLRRSAAVFRDRIAVIDGERRFTYGQLGERAARLAGALRDLGVERGARVAVLSPNTHAMVEAHFGVPFAGAVLVAMNVRLKPAELAYQVDHSAARVLIHDESLREEARAVRDLTHGDLRLVQVGGDGDYEELLDRAEPLVEDVDDERALLSINYTSGTTGRPKGVMYHHRGALLQGLAMAFHAQLRADTVFLWTLPMFHTNGWCFPWAVTTAGARHLCLRKVDAAEIWRLIREQGVTHFNAAPTVLSDLAYHRAAEEGPPPRRILVGTGGAPPTPTLLARLSELGIEVVHLYGLTETFGPAVICEWHPEWDDLPAEEQAARKARQGVPNIISQPLRVVDDNGLEVPADGETLGEITIRGNNLMLGYYADPDATARAIRDGWFRTGDLGVVHEDGYVEVRDRGKDIIISGGENIASVEVERVLTSHPAVLEAAVVAGPHPRWGEVPMAFVALLPDREVSEQALINHVRDQLAHFKAPKQILFGPLPKTSTGKIQKYVLRRQLYEASPDVNAGTLSDS